jgi:hypothetical protein
MQLLFILKRQPGHNYSMFRRLSLFTSRSFSSGLERLKASGFSESDASIIIETIDAELKTFCSKIAEKEAITNFSSILEEKMATAAAFVTSASPFNLPLQSNSTTQATTSTNIASFPTAIDPSILEKEIKLTGQQLTDEVKQLQANHLLDINLDSKRREDSDSLLEEKLVSVNSYAEERIRHLNEHLDRVSRQVLTAIGGTQ